MQLAEVTETFVKDLAGSLDIYLRGQTCASQGVVNNLVREDNWLLGTVDGNHGTYHVRISLAPEGATFTCDCGSEDGKCKHVLAVLVAYLDNKGKI